jgi:rare lipoprotein A (peptidoglycan hydrolase)
MNMRKYIIPFFVTFLMASPIIGLAQDINTNNLTTINYIDSALIKKHYKKIDTSRITIEFNRVTGIASFYSKTLDGTLTSTGERYRNIKYTAASNFFKLNTLVRVTNLKNGKSVLVRINDHMHPNMMRKGRVVDLSQVAAKKLLFKSHGIVRVNVEALGYSKMNPTN